MSILGLRGRASGIVRIDSRLLARIAMKAYDDCWLNYCSDPTLIAERLGLLVEETEGEGEIVGGTIFCPTLRSWRDAGLVTYRLLGKYLLRRSGHPDQSEAAASLVTDELVLPRIVAMRVVSEELPAVQRYAPLDCLRRIYMAHHEAQRPGAGPSVSRAREA